MQEHAVSPAAVAFALTFLGCEQTATGPDLPRDLGPSLAIEGVFEFPTALVLGGTCIDSGSPVSWWPGEDDFNDVVGENHIVRDNGVEFTPGIVGQGFRINQFTEAGQSFMEIDDSPNLQPTNFTIDLWAQRFGQGQNFDEFGNILVQKAIDDDDLSAGVSYLISWNNVNKIVALLSFSVGAPVILEGTSAHGFADPDADPADPFIHVALTYDGTTARLYVNGTVEDYDAPGRSVAYGEGSMVVGATFEAARTRFPRSPDGIIDELEIFDYALTDDQIEQIYLTKGACKLPEEPSPEVDVDIKPGSDDNPINLGTGSGKGGKNSRKSGKGNANIPVAILTTDDFDAYTVDLSTVTLGDDDDEETFGVGITVKKNGTFQAALEDVDDDGDVDLVMHFSIADLVTSEDLNENTVELCVNGETFGGDAIHGCDSVTIVGKADDDD